MDIEFMLALNKTHEIDVLMICYILRHGSGGQTEIANATGKNRQNVYHRAKLLAENGILVCQDHSYTLCSDWKEKLIEFTGVLQKFNF